MNFKLLADKISYPECPRWHSGKVWFSSVFQGNVCTLDSDGSVKVIHKFSSAIAGLGWLPDESLLVVKPLDQEVVRIDQKNNRHQYVSLTNYNQIINNDLFISDSGVVFISGMGNNYIEGEPPKPCSLITIKEHNVYYSANDLLCPNGFAYDSINKFLYVAESNADRITRFHCMPDGTLSDREVYFQFESGDSPDGISLDKNGRLWVACNNHKVVLLKNSKAIKSYHFDQHPLACLVAGFERNELYVLTTDCFCPIQAKDLPNGRIYKSKIEI